MQEPQRKTNRRLACAAAALIAIGAVLITAGAASAATAAHFPVIRFWPSYRVVTLAVPYTCPPTRPSCVWMLDVNEPDVPLTPTVGAPIGSFPTTLEVAYPENFCGVLQADALVGPAPWIFAVGHQVTISSKRRCHGPPASSTTTTQGTVAASSTTPQVSTTEEKSQLPFTVAGASVVASSTSSSAAKTASATLPFTGPDVKPLLVVGAALVIAGLYILTSLEQRRRAVRRLALSVRTSAAGRYTSGTTRWFLGE